MDDKSVSYLIIANALCLFAFLGKNLVAGIIFLIKQKQATIEQLELKEEQEDDRIRAEQSNKIESIHDDIVAVKLEIAKITSQLAIVMKLVYRVPELEKDLNILFQKIKSKSL